LEEGPQFHISIKKREREKAVMWAVRKKKNGLSGWVFIEHDLLWRQKQRVWSVTTPSLRKKTKNQSTTHAHKHYKLLHGHAVTCMCHYQCIEGETAHKVAVAIHREQNTRKKKKKKPTPPPSFFSFFFFFFLVFYFYFFLI